MPQSFQFPKLCAKMLSMNLWIIGGWEMKRSLIVIVIIFTVLLSGCSAESKQAVVNKDSSAYTLDEKDTIKDTSKDSMEAAEKPVPKDTPAAEVSTAKKEIDTAKSISLTVKLFDYLSSEDNRKSVTERANELHGGTLHNSCVYFASEALRRIGVKIPDSMSLIPPFIEALKKQGFKTSYNLEELKPGDICFTTDVNGVFGGRPTHTYIFMGWESPGTAWIADNQLYDYGDVYHTRLMKFHYLNDIKDKPKEATAFFMYK